MSYADYLRTEQINRPRIIDRRQRLGEASNYIQHTKLGASWIQGSTNHVINNQSDPFLPTAIRIDQANRKMPIKFAGSGAGGRVQDASSFTLSRGARAVGADIFSSTKTVQRESIPPCIRATPAPSLVINEFGNFDGQTLGLNQGYQVSCCTVFEPLRASQLVVRNPALDRLGVTSRESWNGVEGTNYGVQNTFNCRTTLTEANHAIKLIPHGNLNSRPIRADFRTAISGPQTSANGEFGRPGKLGGALRRIPYIESHRGNPNIGHLSKLSLAEVTYNKPESYPIPKVE
jgi:hypothetical protein